MRTYRVLITCWRVLGSLFLALGLLPPLNAASAQAVTAEIVLRVDTPAYQWDETGLHVPGYATLDQPGAPALPMWTAVVELPAAGQWHIGYEAGEAITLGLDMPLPAVPVPQIDLDGPSPGKTAPICLPTCRWSIDRIPPSTAATRFYPAQLVQAGPEQWQRGRRLLAGAGLSLPVRPGRRCAALLSHPAHNRYHRRDGPPAVTQAAPAARAAIQEDVDGALRICTSQRGLHRLTYQDLQAAGVPLATLNPATLAMNYLNQPVDIQVTGAADGRFDPGDLVIFYAVPYEGRYMTHNVYQLTYGGNVAGAAHGDARGHPPAQRPAGRHHGAHRAPGAQPGLPQPLPPAAGRRPLVRQRVVRQQRRRRRPPPATCSKGTPPSRRWQARPRCGRRCTAEPRKQHHPTSRWPCA